MSILTVASSPAYRFLGRQVRWSGIPISWRIFHNLVVIHTVKGFSVVNERDVDVFSGTHLLFQWSSGCWQFDLCFLCLFWIQFEHLEVHGSCTVEAWLGEFGHYFPSVWDECSCVVFWIFFGFAFLWDWNKNWPFLVLWHFLSFPNLLAYWVQHFNSTIF